MKALLRSSLICLILLGGVAAFSGATANGMPGAPCPIPRPPAALTH